MDQTVAEVISSSFRLKFCRVCLVKDIKMYSLHEDCLKREFFNITGLQIPAEDGFSQYICYICCALLKKATTFRNRCHNSQKLLRKQEMTQDLLKRIKSHQKLLEQTNVLILNLIDTECSYKTDYSKIKEKYVDDIVEDFVDIKVHESEYNLDYIDGKSFADETNVYTSEENNFVEDFSCTDEKTKLNRNNYKEKNIYKNKRNKTDIQNSNSINNLVHSSIDRLKKPNKCTEDKYIDNTKDKNAIKEEIDSEDDIKPLSLYAAVNTDNSLFAISKNNEKQDKINKTHCKNKKNPKAKVKKDKDKIKINKKELRRRENIEEFVKAYNCKVVTLSREEQIEVVKARAERKKYKNGKFRCDDCYTGFVVESKYLCHRKTHDPAISGDIECEICRLRFKTRLLYMKHAFRHKYKYICKECDAVTYCRSFAKNHYAIHNGTKYECQYCNRVFSKYGSRMNHIRNKHGSKECSICHDLLVSSGLALHLALAHRQTYKCSSCDRVFNDPDALKRHMKSPNDNVCDPEMRPCTRCGKTFRMEDVDLFNKHIEDHRKFKRSSSKSKYPELLCRKRNSKKMFASKDVDIVNYGASGKDGSNENEVGVKKKRKSVKKTRLMCEICASDNFQSITALRYHQRIHTGEKPHQCPTCPKRFRLTHTLQWHIRTHTGDRPYPCKECPKAFKTNTALCRHKLVHTNVRKHVCNYCGKAFQTSSNVKSHVQTVHLKIPMPPRVRDRKKRVEDPRVTSGDVQRDAC